ncbi:MAG: MauE/DoxX family redox-associated membrane protein [Rickettsiales bacterium]
MKNYKPLFIIIIFCFILSFIQATHQMDSMMSYFMGYFFVFLSLFKFFDLKGFVEGFSKYDLLTKKLPLYGYLYPFIEFLLGLGYLSQANLIIINLGTLFIMSLSSIGIIRGIYSGQKIQCACLGTILNVPLSTISIVENFGMGLMAFYKLTLQ